LSGDFVEFLTFPAYERTVRTARGPADLGGERGGSEGRRRSSLWDRRRSGRRGLGKTRRNCSPGGSLPDRVSASAPSPSCPHRRSHPPPPYFHRFHPCRTRGARHASPQSRVRQRGQVPDCDLPVPLRRLGPWSLRPRRLRSRRHREPTPMRAMKRTARPSSPRLRQKSTRGAHDIRVGGLPSLLHGRRETGLRRSDCGLAAGRIARASARPAQPPTSYGPSEAFLPRDRVYEGLASPVPPGRIRSRWAPIRCPRLDCRRCPTRSARPRSLLELPRGRRGGPPSQERAL